MTSNQRHLCCLALCLLNCMCVKAKEVKDTMYSSNGDRVIVDYNKFINDRHNSTRLKALEELPT